MSGKRLISVPIALLVVIGLAAVPVCCWAQAGGRGFSDGVQLFEDGQYERAISTLGAVVKANPGLESAWYYLGRAHLRMPTPDLKAALDAFQHAVEINPQRPGIRLHVGEIYEMQGAYEEAVQVYEEELRLRRGRDLAEVQMALGRVRYLKGDYSRAIERLRDLARLEPLHVECLYYLGLAETAIGQYADAVEHFKRASELCREYQSLHNRLEKGELSVVEQRQKGLTEEYLAQHYGNAATFVSELHLWPQLNKAWGDAQFKAGNWAQARSAYRLRLDLEEGGNAADPAPHTDIALAYLAEASELFNKQGLLFQCIGVVDAAIASIQEALKINENYAPAHAAQGRIYLFQARTYVSMPGLGVVSHTYDEAIASFNKALELQRDHVPAMLHLGVTQTDIGSFTDAVSMLEKAVKLEPNNAEIRAALARAYLGAERPQEAIEEAQTALALDSRNYDALLVGGLADFYYRQRMASAVDQFSKAIRVDDTRPDAYLELGNVYFQMESWYRARAEYQRALECIPEAAIANTAADRARVHYLIAHTYHHSNLYDKEIESLNRALALQPAFVDALRQISRAYEAKEQYRAAVVALETALQSSPNEISDGQIYVQMAQMYERMGRPHDAVAAYTEAVSADPDNHEATQGLERLGAGG